MSVQFQLPQVFFQCDVFSTVDEYLQRWQVAYVINIIVNKGCAHISLKRQLCHILQNQ